MVTSCDPINPYTATGTFGVSYNGGYKPDKSLQWIPPDTNVISSTEEDDFEPVPPRFPAPNMLMQTCEGRRLDPRHVAGGEYKLEYDDYTTSGFIQKPEAPAAIAAIFDLADDGVAEMPKPPKKDEDKWNMLLVITLLLLVILFVTRMKGA